MVETIYWIWHQLLFGFGTNRSHEVLETFPCPKTMYHSLKENQLPSGALTQGEWSLLDKSLEQAKRIEQITYHKGCKIITLDSEDYPPLLKHIYGKPVVLYAVGNVGFLKSGRNFTIVGARRTTDYGIEVTRYITEGLVENGANIVSGLAFGIDSEALKATVEFGGNPVGVLACGLDYDYPKGNAKIKRLVADNGAVISEYPMGTIPRPYMFVPRNRIMAGMSDGIIVTEAGSTSGALVTAQIGFDYNREVFATPASIYSGTFAGTHRLIREGVAKLVTSHKEILGEFGNYYNDKDTPAEEEKKPNLPDGLDKIIYDIYAVMDKDKQTSDEISGKVDGDIGMVLASLTTLELLGLIKSLPGGYFTLK